MFPLSWGSSCKSMEALKMERKMPRSRVGHCFIVVPRTSSEPDVFPRMNSLKTTARIMDYDSVSNDFNSDGTI